MSEWTAGVSPAQRAIRTGPRVGRLRAVLVAWVGVGMAGCADAGGPEGTGAEVRDSAGVRVVANSGVDRPAGFELRKVADLVSPDSALTSVPWGITADPEQRQVYAADRFGSRVLVFDADGRFMRTFGRPGEGPGEFRNPSAVALDPYGALVVWDTGRGVWSRWSALGDLLNEERPPVSYWGPGFSVGRDGLVTVTSRTAPGGVDLVQRLVRQRRQGEPVVLHEITVPQGRVELPCMTLVTGPVFSRDVVWTSAGDTVYHVRGDGYRVDAVVGDSVVASVRREIGLIESTEELAVAAVERGPGPWAQLRRQCDATSEEVARAAGWAETISPVMSLLVDPSGRLWVTRTENGVDPTHLDVFGPEGRYEASLPTSLGEPGVPVAFLSEFRVVMLRRDETTGALTPSVYEVVGAGEEGEATGSDTAPSVEAFRDCDVCPEMVALEGGTYRMGAPEGEAARAGVPAQYAELLEEERPVVEVTVEPFAVGRYEATFAEWDACVEAGGCSYVPDDEGMGRGDRPVFNIHRPDTEEYLRWLRETTGEPYRLPTEAEWEYAARGGTTTARYWGDEIGDGMAVCDGCGSRWDKRSTAPVGSFPPNPFGLHDVLGNVAEWVADCWRPSPGPAEVTQDERCEQPVKKGGSWSTFAWVLRSAQRSRHRPGPWRDRTFHNGFRVALDLPADSAGAR